MNARADGPPIGDAAVPNDGNLPPDAGRDAGPTVTLHVLFKGAGGGQVVIGSQMCTSACDLGFAPGTMVTLAAAPAVGSRFDGWGNACSGSAGCTLTLAADATVEATFNQKDAKVTLNAGTTGPGTVQLAPAGTGCGPGCASLDAGTHVTLTPVPQSGFSFIGWTGGPCDAAQAACELTLTNDVSVGATFCAYNIVVDPAGQNGAAGTCVAPFRNVVHALSVAQSGDQVRVRAGTYDSDAGETFPLIVPAGVTLVGDEGTASTGLATVELLGTGAVVVQLNAGATLAGFLVDQAPPGPGLCVVAMADDVTLRKNLVARCNEGVRLVSGKGATLTGNIVTSNSVGVVIEGAASGVSLDTNLVLSNSRGVAISASADLGGGARGSIGGNAIACNDIDDLAANGAIEVCAKNDLWDGGAAPSMGCDSGRDICMMNSATVNFDGAGQAPACAPIP